jgi:hypothetical protein
MDWRKKIIFTNLFREVFGIIGYTLRFWLPLAEKGDVPRDEQKSEILKGRIQQKIQLKQFMRGRNGELFSSTSMSKEVS